MRRRLLLTTALAASVALALTACGTTQPAATGTASTGKSITLTDASGTKIHLDGPATKIVGTEWNVVESLISLGVNPVGVADVKGYKEWDTAAPLETAATDIGTRGEPSLDTIASLSPDLIVATTDLSSASVKQLRQIAPVLQVRSANASGQVQQMLSNVDLIAKATGTQTKAASIEASFEKTVADGKKAIKAAGHSGERFAFADGWVDSNQVGIRPYVKGSLIGDVTSDLGLTNAWTLTGDKDYGLASTDVEGLTKLGDVQFLYITNASEGDDVFADVLGKNAIWKSLPFVKDDQVHRLADGIWMFGGPASMEAYIHAVVKALTK
ncbi:MAG: transporter substrate-binding protein [Frondihabitans sp.]|nr:transporter substrate-binding protein [Frondihabitans sp.]